MVTFLTVLHIVVCLFLILVVLLQAGKGGGMGIAFGGAGSQTVFGSSGAGNFLTRLTSITAAIFLVTSLSLAHYSSQQDSKRLQQLAAERAEEKKNEDVKAAKLKADLEKTRANAAGTTTGAADKVDKDKAGTVAEPPASAPATAPGLQLKAPGLLDPAVPAKPSTTPGAAVPRSTAPPVPAGGKPAAPPRKAKPVNAAPGAGAPGATSPSEPAAPEAPPAAPAQ